jgi:hypothetical protein
MNKNIRNFATGLTIVTIAATLGLTASLFGKAAPERKSPDSTRLISTLPSHQQQNADRVCLNNDMVVRPELRFSQYC